MDILSNKNKYRALRQLTSKTKFGWNRKLGTRMIFRVSTQIGKKLQVCCMEARSIFFSSLLKIAYLPYSFLLINSLFIRFCVRQAEIANKKFVIKEKGIVVGRLRPYFIGSY